MEKIHHNLSLNDKIMYKKHILPNSRLNFRNTKIIILAACIALIWSKYNLIIIFPKVHIKYTNIIILSFLSYKNITARKIFILNSVLTLRQPMTYFILEKKKTPNYDVL